MQGCDLKGHFGRAHAIEDIRIKEPEQDLIDPDHITTIIMSMVKKHVLLHIVHIMDFHYSMHECCSRTE